jgi:hypothetical protein
VAREPEAVTGRDLDLQPLDCIRPKLDDLAARAAPQVVVVLAPQGRLEQARLPRHERGLKDPSLYKDREGPIHSRPGSRRSAAQDVLRELLQGEVGPAGEGGLQQRLALSGHAQPAPPQELPQ